MMEGFLEGFHRLVEQHRSGEPLLLLFDCDGTLAPFAATPELARVPAGTLWVLDELKRIDRVSVGVISMRSLQDLQRLVPLYKVILAGSGGLELDFHGKTSLSSEAAEAALRIEPILGPLSMALQGQSGAWLEEKRLGFTVHYRGTLPELHEALIRRIEGLLVAHGGSLSVFRGAFCIEALAAPGWDKGRGIGRILGRLRFSCPNILYAGDGESDASAMGVVAALGGLTVSVGPSAPRKASVHLHDPAELVEVLRFLHKGLRTGPGSPLGA